MVYLQQATHSSLWHTEVIFLTFCLSLTHSLFTSSVCLINFRAGHSVTGM